MEQIAALLDGDSSPSKSHSFGSPPPFPGIPLRTELPTSGSQRKRKEEDDHRSVSRDDGDNDGVEVRTSTTRVPEHDGGDGDGGGGVEHARDDETHNGVDAYDVGDGVDDEVTHRIEMCVRWQFDQPISSLRVLGPVLLVGTQDGRYVAMRDLGTTAKPSSPASSRSATPPLASVSTPFSVPHSHASPLMVPAPSPSLSSSETWSVAIGGGPPNAAASSSAVVAASKGDRTPSIEMEPQTVALRQLHSVLNELNEDGRILKIPSTKASETPVVSPTRPQGSQQSQSNSRGKSSRSWRTSATSGVSTISREKMSSNGAPPIPPIRKEEAQGRMEILNEVKSLEKSYEKSLGKSLLDDEKRLGAQSPPPQASMESDKSVALVKDSSSMTSSGTKKKLQRETVSSVSQSVRDDGAVVRALDGPLIPREEPIYSSKKLDELRRGTSRGASLRTTTGGLHERLGKPAVRAPNAAAYVSPRVVNVPSLSDRADVNVGMGTPTILCPLSRIQIGDDEGGGGAGYLLGVATGAGEVRLVRVGEDGGYHEKEEGEENDDDDDYDDDDATNLQQRIQQTHHRQRRSGVVEVECVRESAGDDTPPEDILKWYHKVEAGILHMDTVCVDGLKDASLCVCSWMGQTYIITEEGKMVRYAYNRPVLAFCAGSYAPKAGQATAALVYVTNSGVEVFHGMEVDSALRDMSWEGKDAMREKEDAKVVHRALYHFQ